MYASGECQEPAAPLQIRWSEEQSVFSRIVTTVLHFRVMGEMRERVKYECEQQCMVHACTISCKLIYKLSYLQLK
jgi:hypothetical protein